MSEPKTEGKNLYGFLVVYTPPFGLSALNINSSNLANRLNFAEVGGALCYRLVVVKVGSEFVYVFCNIERNVLRIE